MSAITMASLTGVMNTWGTIFGGSLGGIFGGVILGGVAIATTIIGIITFSTLEQTKVIKMGYLLGGLVAFSGMVSNMPKAQIDSSIIFFSSFPVIINFLLISFIISEQISKKDSQFKYLGYLRLYVTAWASTCFQKANLIGATFYQSDLKYANFSNSILIRTNFYQVQNLEFAYVKNTILEQNSVRELLIHGKTEQKAFIAMDLTGAYLVDADLQGINFTDSNFSYADLRGANLCGANLTQVQAIGVNFEGANLTGTCLEKWTINSDTSLKNIQADYVYFRNNLRERAPNIKTFDIGEFNLAVFFKILENIYGELHFQLNDGQKIRIESVKYNNDDSLIIQFVTSEKTNNFNLSKQQYQKVKKIIIEKDKKIQQLQDLIQKLTITSKSDIYIHSQAQVNNTGQQNIVDKKEQNINIDGDASNSNISAGDNAAQTLNNPETRNTSIEIIDQIQDTINKTQAFDDNQKQGLIFNIEMTKKAIIQNQNPALFIPAIRTLIQDCPNVDLQNDVLPKLTQLENLVQN